MARTYASLDAIANAAPVYEEAGPQLLMEQAASLSADQRIEKLADNDNAGQWELFREHLEQRIKQFKSWRSSWLQHWALIAQYILPRRSMWLAEGGLDTPTPNAMIRGLPINQSILDPTATYCSQIASAGMMSGLMSPSRPWFKLGPALENIEIDEDGTLWFEDVERRIYTVMAHSNYYDAVAQMMEDLVNIGTAPMLIYEDKKDLIRCQNPVAGEYYLAVGSAFRPESFARLFVMTVSQIVEMFGLDACPVQVADLWEQKGAQLETEFVIAHLIEPNFAIQRWTDQKPYGAVPGDYTFKEAYWLWGIGTQRPLAFRGFHDLPFIAPRWWVTGSDPYGRSPAMNALGDVMQLQIETLRKGELLEKLVRPPMNAPAEMKNQPTSILPGGINYTPNPAQGMVPVFQVDGKAIPALTEDIKEIQQRIKTGFFNDLFLMLVQSTKDETAFEVAQKQQEKLQVLGPVIERFNNEAAGPAIMRIFSILKRKGAIPPLPQSLRNIPIQIEYISILALAQKAVATAGIERLMGFGGNMAAVFPEVRDNIDPDATFREYGNLLGVTHRIMVPKQKMAQNRKIKAQQAQQQAQAAQAAQMATHTAPAMADAAQTLSQTPTGGGISALDMMLGNSDHAPLPQ